MQQLDSWTDEVVIAPLLDNGPEVIEDVHKAIRAKVLESYRNGQAAGPAKQRVGTGGVRKEWSHAQAKTR